MWSVSRTISTVNPLIDFSFSRGKEKRVNDNDLHLHFSHPTKRARAMRICNTKETKYEDHGKILTEFRQVLRITNTLKKEIR